MIDVHVGVNGTEPREWVDRCLASLARCPVNVHIVDSSNMLVGTMRAMAYQRGTADYVSYVDPDDWVEPWTYQWALAQLEDPRVSATYVNHGLYEADGITRTQAFFTALSPAVGYAQEKQMHHGVVHRRAFIEPVLHLMKGMSRKAYQVANLQALRCGRVVGSVDEGYGWRVHENGLHRSPAAPHPPETVTWARAMRKQLLAGPVT